MSTRILHLLASLCVVSASLVAARADDAPPAFKVDREMAIGGPGRWDYIAFDPATKLLYVPRTTHVMVIDSQTGKPVADIPKTGGVHGVALAPKSGRGFASNGNDKTVTVFDLKTHATLGAVAAADDADAIIYDPASNRVLTFCGDANVMVAMSADVDPAKDKADVVELGGKPEFAVADGEGHAFANIQDKNEVVMIDTKTLKVTARWPTAPGTKPTSLAYDPKTRRLFVGCRNKLLLVMDAQNGKLVAQFPIGDGVDATAFDDGLILASCSDGTLHVVREDSADKFTPVQVVKTAPGARTLVVDPATHTVYLPTGGKPTGGGEAAFRIVVVTRK